MKLNSDELKSRLQSGVQFIDESSKNLDELVNLIVNKSCSELDDYVRYVKALLDDETKPITNLELDDIVMTLPTLLYFASSNQEIVGLREDIAKMTETEAYNIALQEAEGTVQDKQASAKLQTQNETLTTIVYQRATRQIKARTESALEVLQSCKKVLSRRLVEFELSKSSPARNQQ